MFSTATKLDLRDSSPKNEISPWFTHPQVILGVYDFLLSKEYNRSYIKKYPGSSKLYNDSDGCWNFEVQ